MKLAKTRIIYNRRGKLNKENKAALVVEVYQSGVHSFRKFINTDILLKENEWNDEKKIVTSKNINHIRYNKMVSDLCHSIEAYAYDLHIKDDVLTQHKLDIFLNGKQINANSFISFYKNEIDPNMKRGTRKEHEYTYNLLFEFRNEILFSEININLIKEFNRFLVSKGLKQNTIAKHHEHIKRFLNIAYLNGLFDDVRNPYHHLKSLLKRVKSDRISLSMEELGSIEEKEINEAYPELQLAKDLFLFSCYSGLRFSDVISLEKKHLIKDEKGNNTIIKKMEKVDKPVTLPVSLLFNGKSVQYILKYIDGQEDYVFPRVSNQHVNRQLKILAQGTLVKMRLTFHVARHTFGTMLAEITYNPYLIMKLMGHADIETSMIYIHLSQKHINKQLENVNW
jgi:integrase